MEANAHIFFPFSDYLNVSSASEVEETTSAFEGRGRRRSAKNNNSAITTNLEQSTYNPDSGEEDHSIRTGTSRTKRKRKINQYFEAFETSIRPQQNQEEDASVSQNEDSSPKPKRRKKGNETKTEKSTKTSTLPDDTIFKVPVSKFFTCGNCKESILATKWKQHTHDHYGLLWKEGIEQPIDLSNTQAQAVALTKYMKLYKFPYLKCRQCEIKKKSAIGYLSHLESCGLSAEEMNSVKVACQYCKKLYRKASIQSHEQGFCPVVKAARKEAELASAIATTTADMEDENPVMFSETGRPQRTKKKKTYKEFDEQAAIEDFVKVTSKVTGGVIKGWENQLKRNKIIKCSGLNCAFTATDIKSIQIHHKQCDSKPYSCRLCKYSGGEIQTMIDHVKEYHTVEWESVQKVDDDSDKDYTSHGEESDSSSDDASVGEQEVDSDQELKKRKRKSKLNVERYMEQNSKLYWNMVQDEYTTYIQSKHNRLPMTIRWTKEFIIENYEKLLFSIEQEPKFDEVYEDYTSVLNFKSIPFQYHERRSYRNKIELSNEWYELELFNEMKLTDKEVVLFCGGPIIVAEWVPFPCSYSGPQILALCSKSISTPNTNVRKGQVSPAKYLIQFWSLESAKSLSTRLLYAVAFDDGPALSIKFCPSGCFIPDKQLALMAVPTFNGSVNLVSLPIQIESDLDEVKIIKPETKLSLQTCLNDETCETVTQLAWSHSMGHSIVCAAYTTGMIALWNLQHTKSSYLCDTNDIGCKVLLPYRMFYATSHCISHVELRHDSDNEVRWILVGGLDRKTHLYDLHDCVPMEAATTVLKSRVVGGNWPINWSLCLSLVDDAVTYMHVGMNVRSPLAINQLTPSTNFIITGTPSNLAFSNWLNTAVFGNHIGHLFKKQFDQLLIYNTNDRNVEVIGCTHVFPLSDPIDESIEDERYERIVDLFQDQVEVGDENVVESIRNIHEPVPLEAIIRNEENKGIVFSDFMIPLPLDQVKKTLARERRSTENEDLFAKINKVAVNPNSMAYELYAVGYEKGFCRIKRLLK